jgi:hypothetical protein
MTAMAATLLATSLAQAQFVSMTGEYHESSGRIVKIPQNPPLAICGAGGVITAQPADDARCHGARITVFSLGMGFGPFNFAKPQTGVPAVKATHMGGLGVGDTFTLQPLAFSQMQTNLSGQVVGNAVVQIDTSFTAALPGTARLIAPPAVTRVMRQQGAVPISGQTGRVTGPVVVHTDATGAESVTLTYTEGPNKFGGTMTALLAGGAKLYIKAAGFDAIFPVALQPVLGTQPVGGANTLLVNQRNGAGWDYTVMGGQDAGIVYGPADISTPCTTAFPTVAPAGCNLVTVTGPNTNPALPPFLLDVGNFLPAATSTKHQFAWTTGTVSVARIAFRAGNLFTETLTAMGYDNTSMTGAARNVGLVAGSYTKRTAGTGIELNPQMIGLDLHFTPEPAATASLLAGMGLLGFLVRRKLS